MEGGTNSGSSVADCTQQFPKTFVKFVHRAMQIKVQGGTSHASDLRSASTTKEIDK